MAENCTEMIEINISEEFKNICPHFRGVAIRAKVKNKPSDDKLWAEIEAFSKDFKANHLMEDIKENPVIAATRQAYKSFGKDPNRYRPSSEALQRRILKDMPLYRIDTLVDIINLVSLKTGYSIGGFDADKINGNIISLGVGKTNEPYKGIGKGLLNIEGLPIYRDSSGGIGTPTSDNERTKIDGSTTNLLAVINGYSGREGLQEAALLLQNLLIDFAESDGDEIFYF